MNTNIIIHKCYRSVFRNFRKSKLCTVNHAFSTKAVEKADQPNSYQPVAVKPGFVSTKIVRKKQPQKPPFAKNLFLGVFDTDILTYPEALNKDQLAELEKKLAPIKEYFYAVDFSAFDATGKIPESICKELSAFGLFGQEASPLYGGLELNVTEAAKLFEVISKSGSLASILHSQRTAGIVALDKFGTETQKNKYFLKLVDGIARAAFCLQETTAASVQTLKTKAVPSETDDTWILNGEKNFILNGNHADFFLVFALTDQEDHVARPIETLTAFLVDRSCGGITSTPIDTIGIKASDVSHVKFKDTVIPSENVLGKVGGGIDILMSCLLTSRELVGAECTTVLKTALEHVSHLIISAGTSERRMHDLEWVQIKVAKIAVWTYAMESMTYLTLGLKDMYEDQNVDLETAITKVFSSEFCVKGLEECASIIGAESYQTDNVVNKLMNDAKRHLLFDELNSTLKLSIAMIGLQHAGKELNESVKHLRNPFFYPWKVIQKTWHQRLDSNDTPKLGIHLSHYLHPNLLMSADLLEYSVYRLKYATEILLSRHGKFVIEKHADLERLANVAIEIYAMAAVLGRASRSYCIGLEFGENEMLMAGAFCVDATDRVRKIVAEIDAGPYVTNERNLVPVAERIIKSKGYFPEHPLARNF